MIFLQNFRLNFFYFQENLSYRFFWFRYLFLNQRSHCIFAKYWFNNFLLNRRNFSKNRLVLFIWAWWNLWKVKKRRRILWYSLWWFKGYRNFNSGLWRIPGILLRWFNIYGRRLLKCHLIHSGRKIQHRSNIQIFFLNLWKSLNFWRVGRLILIWTILKRI